MAVPIIDRHIVDHTSVAIDFKLAKWATRNYKRKNEHFCFKKVQQKSVCWSVIQNTIFHYQCKYIYPKQTWYVDSSEYRSFKTNLIHQPLLQSDDMEDYGFEYSDEDYAEEDVDIENQYYNSKGTKICHHNVIRSTIPLTISLQQNLAQVFWRARNSKKPSKASNKS